MSEVDKRVCEVGDDTFSSAIELRRDRFIERGYLSNSHGADV